MPASIDTIVIEVLVGTYGKTVHAWRFDAQELEVPIGVPELVMGYTEDGQITPEFVKARDKLFGVSSTEVRERRGNITVPEILPGADSWKLGFVSQYGLINTTAETVFGS
jgi:hypothetical protein